MIQEGLYTFLAASSAVATIVGTRIYPLMIPQHAYDELTKLPCLVYARVSVDRQPKFCGTDALARSLVRVDSYARSYADATALAAAVYDALIDYSGAMGSETVKKVLADSEFDLLDVEPGLYRVTQTFSIWHIE